MPQQTFMTRKDEGVGEGVFDSIAWIFETHLQHQSNGAEFNFAMLTGNEDAPEKIELWREEPNYDRPPDKVWEMKCTASTGDCHCPVCWQE